MTQKIRVFWGDGEHDFLLAIGQLRELQVKCNAGIGTILQRLTMASYYVDDIREIVRLGLIGGGKTPEVAYLLVENYCDKRPIGESIHVAFAVLTASILGVQDDPVGEPLDEEAPITDEEAPITIE